MIKCIRVITLITAVLLLTACASVQVVTRSKNTIPSYRDKLEGKSISIIPFGVSFGASRFVMDLRDVTVTVGDQSFKLQERYIAKDKDRELGEIGILDVDILTKSKTDKEIASRLIVELLKSGLTGTLDYHIGFFKGLGEDNMGELSNRPIDYDRSVYPPKVIFLQADNPAVFFTDIQVLEPDTRPTAANTDLVLTGDVSISSEVVEVLSDPNTGFAMNPTAHIPAVGDYYLTLFGSVRFKLIDVKTGEVIVSEKTKRDWPVKDIIAGNIYLPVKKGDASAYAKYFREVDFIPILTETINNFLPSILPLITPYYVNTTHQVKAEK